MRLTVSTLIVVLSLFPPEQDGTSQNITDPEGLAAAIRSAHPEATQWTIHEHRSWTDEDDRGVIVTVDLPPHRREGRVTAYRSLTCWKSHDQIAWSCHADATKALVDVSPPTGYEPEPGTCPTAVRRIEIEPDQIPAEAPSDLVDFLAFSGVDRASIATRSCQTPPPACAASLIRAESPDTFGVGVHLDAYEWFSMRLRRDCVGTTCSIHPLACDHWTV